MAEGYHCALVILPLETTAHRAYKLTDWGTVFRKYKFPPLYQYQRILGSGRPAAQ